MRNQSAAHRAVLSRASRRPARAFTLVELMVALTGGLVFSIFVFMLTRDVTRFFQQETGLSDATTSMLAGYQRLRADVQRAGFLASPNLIKDVGRCPGRNPRDSVPTAADVTALGTQPLLRTLALARVTSPTPTTWQAANGLAPNDLTLYGNYTTADQYPVRAHVAGSTGNPIYLDPNSEELARAGYPSADADALMKRIFPAGSILRAVSANTGEEQYSVVAQASEPTAGAPQIALAVALAAKAGNTSCGIRGLGADLLVNPVNIIRYRLGVLSADANFAALYPTGGDEAAWPRFDLLRDDLTAAGAVNNTELVAEFAVDFRLSAQVVTDTATSATTYYPEGDTNLAAYVGPSTDAAALVLDRGPHLIRALRPRLAIRTRSPDRQANVATSAGAGLYRVPLTAGANFARVRTLQSFIMTRNARNETWR